jgi:hypothetical protein
MFELTSFVKHDGPLSKKIALGADGKPISDGSACIMSRGIATRVRLPDLHSVAQFIGSLGANEAIALGALRGDLPDHVEVTAAARLRELNGTTTLQFIARTADYITFTQGRAGLALVDYDMKAMPAHIRQRIDALGGFQAALQSVLPELAMAGCVVRASTSAGLYRGDTGERFARAPLPACHRRRRYGPLLKGPAREMLACRLWLADDRRRWPAARALRRRSRCRLPRAPCI